MEYSHWCRLAVFYVISQTASLLGSFLVHCTIIWHITLTIKSGSALAIVALCGFTPMFLISGFAGVWADRYSCRKLIVAADAAVALATLVVMLAFMRGYKELQLMYAVLAIRSLGSGVQSPVVSALTPQFVPKERLMKVNGISGSVQSLGNVTSPAVAGILLTFWPLYLVFAVDVVTAIIGIFLLLVFVKVEHHNPGVAHETSQLWKFKLGLVHVRQHFSVGRSLIYQALCTFFLGGPVVIGSLQITRVSGADSWCLATVEACFGIGAAWGGLVVSAWAGAKQEYKTIGITLTLLGALTMGLAVSPQFWCFAGFTALVGLVVPYCSVPTMTLLQRTINPDQMGRVMSISTMIAIATMPLGSGILSPLADAFDVRLVMAASTFDLVLSGLLIWRDRQFAKTPLPDAYSGSESELEQPAATTVETAE